MSFLCTKNKKKKDENKEEMNFLEKRSPSFFDEMCCCALWINTKVGIENKQCKSLFWGVCVLAVQLELKQARKKDKMPWKKRKKLYFSKYVMRMPNNVSTYWQILFSGVFFFTIPYRHFPYTTNYMSVNSNKFFFFVTFGVTWSIVTKM